MFAATPCSHELLGCHGLAPWKFTLIASSHRISSEREASTAQGGGIRESLAESFVAGNMKLPRASRGYLIKFLHSLGCWESFKLGLERAHQ